MATLVAEGATPEELFAAVATEVSRVLAVPAVTLARYGPDRTITVLAAPSNPDFPVGSRWPLNGPSIAATIRETGRRARIDDYSTAPGELAAAARASAMRSAVAVPITLDGALWGLISVGTTDPEPLPADTEDRLAEFTELVAVAISHAESQDRLHRLTDERAAVRRVATLVAEGAPGATLFLAVVQEVVRLLEVPGGALLRYEPDRSVTVLASVDFPGLTLGSRYPLDGPSLAATILDTGRPARIDDYSQLEGTIAASIRNSGFRSAFAVPIMVDRAVWGLIGVGTDSREPLPADADARLRDLTELLAGAISNAEARDRLRRLADGQAALRRVATLVAEGAPAADLLAAVVDEIKQVLDAPAIALLRYEPDRTATVVASLNAATTGRSENATQFTVGSRWPLDGPSLSATVLDTGRPTRIDDYSALSGAIASGVRGSGLRSTVGVPIVVDGKVWGVIIVGTLESEPLPVGLEARLRDFTELVAIAISNAESRDRRGQLTDQQVALRRVATLAAEGATLDEIFSSIAKEVAGVADVSAVTVVRFERDGQSVVVASFHDPGFPVGSRWPLDRPSLQATILDTGGPGRIDDYAEVEGPIAAAARTSGVRCGVGAPIIVDGCVWGMIAVGMRQRRDALPTFAGSYTGRIVLAAESTQDIEAQLTPFTKLGAIAVSKARAHEDLRQLAEEQAALRRVATLVARGSGPSKIFAAVVDEIASILGLQGIEMARYEADGTAVVIGASGDHPFAPGSGWTLDDPSVMASVFRTRRPARIDDYRSLRGTIAETAVRAGFRSAIGAPIIVDGATWGVIVAFSTMPEPISERAEVRLGQFTELVATAVSNATARADLLASRARIVAAGDEARRRFERNLHDGTQQRLLALRLDLQVVRAAFAEDALRAQAGLEQAERDLEAVLEEVREVSRGLHPAQLSRGGLGPALRAVARRSPIPTDIHVDVDERPPARLETAVYYVVSEALTNAMKHSHASAIAVTVAQEGAALRATIADDGVGGAAAGSGSGLVGLADRVEALGGRFALESPRGRGTTISIELPIATPVAP
jgi:signal transduction histidine kinase